MGKKDGKAVTTAPQVDPNIIARIANPPQRGVDSNLSALALVRKKQISGSVAVEPLLTRAETLAH